MIEPLRNKEPRNILNVLNQNGMRGGRLDIFAYRAAGKDRKAVELFFNSVFTSLDDGTPEQRAAAYNIPDLSK